MTNIPDAAELRRKAHEQWRKDDVTRALLEERRGYVTRAAAAEAEDDAKGAGKWSDRVAQVDAELRRIGSEDAIPAEEKPRRTRKAAAAAPSGDGADSGTGDGAGAGS